VYVPREDEYGIRSEYDDEEGSAGEETEESGYEDETDESVVKVRRGRKMTPVVALGPEWYSQCVRKSYFRLTLSTLSAIYRYLTNSR